MNLLNAYCETHTTPQSPLLYELERETHLKTLSPQMLSGHLQGQLLTFISQMLHPQAILEIGTFTGYSAICMAQGLAEGGVLHTIETNVELQSLIKKYITKSGLEAKIILHFGKAEELIPSLDVMFDLVFIDAGKQQYAQFYDLVFDKVRPGGFILADNVLWSGKVIRDEMDEDTQAIRAFNDKVQHDDRVENMILPLRDGIMMVRKR
jgi:predicted O-methyltransferase YrrM